MSLMRMTEAATARCYDIWAGFYDHTFGALVHKRQVKAIETLAPEPGSVVLDLGIGTGMTLTHYPAGVKVVGMDLSMGMLAKGLEKIREQSLEGCWLVQGDAMRLPFAERSFDHVMISHTISVVSEPAKLLPGVERMVKPGGRVVVLNHFRSEVGAIGLVEKAVNPVCVKVGWRSDLSLEECLAETSLELDYRFKLRAGDLWQIVVLRAPQRSREGAAAGAGAAEEHG